MLRASFLDHDIHEIQSLVTDLASRYDSVEEPKLLREAKLAAHELPRWLRTLLLDFRYLEPDGGVCLVSDYPIDEERIGPTPQSWGARTLPPCTLSEEMLFMLMGSLLGDPIGWATQQDGRLMHDILPIRGLEQEQLGCGSEVPLTWHTEDAFHPYRGDHLGMMCLRNPDRVPTTIGTVALSRLAPRHLDLLFEPHFTIRPDESHLAKHKAEQRSIDEDLRASYAHIERMRDQPEKIALLYGSRQAPYLRIDPYFMEPVPDPPEAQAALDALIEVIEVSMQDLALSPGDFCFIDNFRMVHGRKPFKARYDGTDRWLKRINIAHDLRKSRSARGSSDSRVLH